MIETNKREGQYLFLNVPAHAEKNQNVNEYLHIYIYITSTFWPFFSNKSIRDTEFSYFFTGERRGAAHKYFWRGEY